MILTGVCKTDFEKWYDKEHKEYHFYEMNNFSELIPILQYALIIDFFDSNGIFINSSGLTLSKSFMADVSINSNCEYNFDDFNSRQKATEEAIKFANEYYNKQYDKKRQNNELFK